MDITIVLILLTYFGFAGNEAILNYSYILV